MNAEIEAVLSGESKWCVVQGNCLEVMVSLPADCLSLCFGSPPYVGARLYLENGQNLGIAREAEEWSAWMVEVFRASLRVSVGLTAMVVEGQTENFSYDAAPFLLAADLRRAGFTLRKPPIYRRVGIPGSGGPDWLRNDYEPIIAVTRGGKLPWSDNTACGHTPKFGPGGECSHRSADGRRSNWQKKGVARGYKNGDTQNDGTYIPPAKANPGNVTQHAYTSQEVAELLADSGNLVDCKVGGGLMGSALAHENEAPFPESLAGFFVRSFCPPDGVVLDPFAGSGTTLAAALANGRRAIGIDLRASQVALTKRRLAGVTPSMFSVC